ncbi:contact-dependent growth inhibition system immunity protein [Streptomyces sp. NPDC001407]|uniref:contact-dependent growth inhibition system immunity protein n=1 Tax=Streptomyces sp. NPDC001407 TaxID=3364573 RepID=UPI0036C0A37B
MRTRSDHESRSMRDNRRVARRTNPDRSLEELEDDRWPAPAADATRLVATVHALRRRPIGSLTVEDLRVLIGQDVGLPYLLPVAMSVLREDPLAEGDMYEGDLLAAVVTRKPFVWSEFPELARELRVLAPKAAALSPALRPETDRFLGQAPGTSTAGRPQASEPRP